MNGQQISAPKPIHLAPKPSGIAPPKSPAALHGATIAFLPRSVAPTVSISPTSSGARLAAFAAGIPAQQLRPTLKTPESKYERPKSLPPRGRQLRANPLTTTLKSTTSSIIPSDLTRPPLQSRSSSTLAARHATENSRSPDRNTSKSGDFKVNSALSMRQNKWNTQSTDALAGATASMASRALKPAQIESKPVKSRIINFEKLPVLTSPERLITLDRFVGKDTATMRAEPTGLEFGDHQHVDAVRPAVKETPKYSTIRKLVVPAGIIRQLSEESTITIATATTGELSKPEESPQISHISNSVPSTPKPLNIKSPLQEPIRAHDDYKKLMTVNALADAMVASSLASSRATSPAKKQPPPAARRRSRSVAALYEMNSHLTTGRERRPLKQARPMKHTLRKPAASDDEETELTKRGRRHWMRKHPNKHSEGDRKRWRDEITDLERKRYEGVFAANRGLLIGPGYFEPSPSALINNKTSGNHVVNVIVRDIWERSRLPREALREIYDLVSPEEAHTLNREQFVVGLWLIDQRLKGRKLPVKVSSSVWASVRMSQDIKIKKH